jgi:hypothetical protein
VNDKIYEIIETRKENLGRRLENSKEYRSRPMFNSGGAIYDISKRTSAIHCGGIGLMHEMANRTDMVEILNGSVRVFKKHRPYFESDHILNMAYNILCGGTCLEDIELLRNNEAYMNALGARRIPDPTTAGDFLRRFRDDDIHDLSGAIGKINVKMWKKMLSRRAREVGILDIDGKIQETYGECKEGMDVSYNGKWGFSVMLLTEATTGIHTNVINRPGNALSQEEAEQYLESSIATMSEAFGRIMIRGDTAFSLTWKFDEWTERGVDFIFGYDAHPNIEKIAENTGENRWRRLNRINGKKVAIVRRRRKPRVKALVVKRRKYRTLTQNEECVSEFKYRPGKCGQEYRMIAVRKRIGLSRGQAQLFNVYKYFFYITNIKDKTPEKLVRLIMGRCNHENRIEQMANGVRALKMPAAEFNANWAYMLIGALAWNMKAYIGLIIPDKKKASEILRCEFKRFQNALINIPCQILTTGRRIVYRFLNYSPWVEVIFASISRMRALEFT